MQRDVINILFIKINDSYKNEKYTLKRTKPVINKHNTLDNCMNLKIETNY